MSERSSRPIWLGVDKRGWDHVRVHVQLLKDQRLGAFELGAYMGLAAHAELQTGEARPSAETLARYINASERTVRRAIKTLIDAGYVVVERRVGKASHYYLVPPPTPDTESALFSDTPDIDDTHPGQRFRATPDRGSDEQEPITRTKNKRIENPDGLARFPSQRPYCPACEGIGKRKIDDNTYSHEPCTECAA